MKIARHTLYNFVGLGAPLAVALFTIPALIHALGDARFGLLTLVWAVVSYFGLFDLGLGRALTQQIAVTFARNAEREVGPLVATASVLMLILGLLAGIALAAAAPVGVSLIRGVSDPREVERAVYWMAATMPAIVMTSGFRGVLEAQHAFAAVNLVRLPMGVFTFVGPLLVVWLAGPRLDWIAAVLSAGRLIACVVHAALAWRVLPPASRQWQVNGALIRPLCVSGGWLTVSNVVSPFMGYVDRFVIGALVSSSAVAYYATPNELITKLWIVPGALTAVLFPTFAAQAGRADSELRTLFGKSLRWLLLLMLPVTGALAWFAAPALSLWIGPEFAAHSARLMQIFALGMLVNSLAHIPFTVMQSAGAAHLTAAVHSLELPFFVAALWLLTSQFGLIGAALAWLLRIAADTALMFWLCYRLMHWSLPTWRRSLA